MLDCIFYVHFCANIVWVIFISEMTYNAELPAVTVFGAEVSLNGLSSSDSGVWMFLLSVFATS